MHVGFIQVNLFDLCPDVVLPVLHPQETAVIISRASGTSCWIALNIRDVHNKNKMLPQKANTIKCKFLAIA